MFSCQTLHLFTSFFVSLPTTFPFGDSLLEVAPSAVTTNAKPTSPKLRLQPGIRGVPYRHHGSTPAHYADSGGRNLCLHDYDLPPVWRPFQRLRLERWQARPWPLRQPPQRGLHRSQARECHSKSRARPRIMEADTHDHGALPRQADGRGAAGAQDVHPAACAPLPLRRVRVALPEDDQKVPAADEHPQRGGRVGVRDAQHCQQAAAQAAV